MSVAVFPLSTYSGKTLLEMVQAMAKNVGLDVPEQIVGSTERTWIEALDFANTLGDELARRVDWGGLIGTSGVVGTGADAALDLPSDFERFPTGVTVTYSGAILRPLSRAEWTSLTAVEGTPRYFLLENKTIRFFPYLASAVEVDFTYVSDLWCTGGDNFLADSDQTVFPDDLFIMGLIVRWRRQKGMDYADFEAEYEAALSDYAAFDDRRQA